MAASHLRPAGALLALLLSLAPISPGRAADHPVAAPAPAAAMRPGRRPILHHVVRRAVRAALIAVAKQLGMSPAQLRTAIRGGSLTLPAGVTVSSLEATGQAAARTYVQGVASTHPRFTAGEQQLVLRRAAMALHRLLARATAGTSGG